MALSGLQSVRGIKDWDGGLDQAVQALGAAEAAVLGTSSKPRRYRRAGRVLVARERIGANIPGWSLDRQLKAVLTGIGHSPLAVQMSLVKAADMDLPCRADIVLMKAHLRGFYLAEGLTIKVPNPGRATGRERFAQEVAMRKSLRDTDHVFVPELAAVPDDLGAVFVAEKIVAAKELPAGFPDDRLASWLMEFYAGNGLRPEALQDHLQLDQAWPAITELCRERNLRIPAQLSAWVDKAEDTAGAVLCAPCNGDLTQTNLLVAGERLCIIDWEYLNHGPVCRDVIRLSTQRRGFSWHWLRELEAVSASHEANLLSPRDQFIAATIMVIMERIQREHEFSDPASRRAYRERMKGRIAKILALSERVLDADQ